jgi:hypothetical protein
MKTLILLLIITGGAYGQSVKDLDKLEWKPIKEMSGPIWGYEGLTVDVKVAAIARRDDGVKVVLRFDYPWGAPGNVFKIYPHGFDLSSISRVVYKADVNCQSLTLTFLSNSTDVYQFNGKRHKSKEAPQTMTNQSDLVRYFCEQGSAPTVAPTLRRKP